jgi:hypothetical protein
MRSLTVSSALVALIALAQVGCDATLDIHDHALASDAGGGDSSSVGDSADTSTPGTDSGSDADSSLGCPPCTLDHAQVDICCVQ